MLSLLDQAAVSNHIWHTAHVPSNIAAWLCSLVNLPTYLPDGPDLHPPPLQAWKLCFHSMPPEFARHPCAVCETHGSLHLVLVSACTIADAVCIAFQGNAHVLAPYGLRL